MRPPHNHWHTISASSGSKCNA